MPRAARRLDGCRRQGRHASLVSPAARAISRTSRALSILDDMLWLRVAVIHPVVPVAVLVVASYVLGSGGEAFVGIVWLLGLLLLAAPVAAAFPDRVDA
jgi:hypothetical protein